MSRESDYIGLVRQKTKEFWDSYHTLRALQTEWNALAYGDNLDDGEGENAGYTAAEVGAVLFATMDKVKEQIFDTGHATNLAKLL